MRLKHVDHVGPLFEATDGLEVDRHAMKQVRSLDSQLRPGHDAVDHTGVSPIVSGCSSALVRTGQGGAGGNSPELWLVPDTWLEE